MKKLMAILVVALLSFMTTEARAEEAGPPKNELGVVVGQPGGINLLLGRHLGERFVVHVSGIGISDESGKVVAYELTVAYKVKSDQKSYHALGIGMASQTSKAPTEKDKKKDTDFKSAGLVYQYRKNAGTLKGFYVEVGPSYIFYNKSAGTNGEAGSPWMFGQIGWSYAF